MRQYDNGKWIGTEIVKQSIKISIEIRPIDFWAKVQKKFSGESIFSPNGVRTIGYLYTKKKKNFDLKIFTPYTKLKMNYIGKNIHDLILSKHSQT